MPPLQDVIGGKSSPCGASCYHSICVVIKMKRFANILVATDTALDDHPIVAEAAEIATQNNARIKIVDVVPELPWTVKFTLKDHAHYTELIRAEKEAKLASLAEPLQKNGLDVATAVLSGVSSTELIREVLRYQHDLVLRVAKGSHSRSSGFFGTTGMKLLRQCPCPVWLVAPGTTPKFKHIVACVDPSGPDDKGDEFDDEIIELAKSISEYHQANLSIVHAWSMFGGQVLKWKMDADEYERAVAKNRQHAMDRFDAFLVRHGYSAASEQCKLLDGDPAPTISHFVKQSSADLIIMGTVARSGLSGAIMGNIAEQMLNRIECSVLALKPASFQCPIRLAESD